MKKKYVILLDTETLNGIPDGKGGVDLTDSLVYDLGWQVIDLHGNVYEQRSYTIYDTFVEMKQEMKSAYYANKIPKYEQEIKSGQRTLARLSTARKQLYDDMIKYNSNIVCAHNCSFDLRALNNTIRYITKSKFRYFFPRGTIFWDTLKMANQTYKNEWGYRKFCEQNGYMTKHKVPQPRMTAEIIFRYISGNDVFEEEHTGLADVQIESEILWAIMRKHKKLDRELFSKGGL